MSLLDDVSIVVTPNGYKSGVLYSVIPSSGAGDLEVVRGTAATRVDEAGLVNYAEIIGSEEVTNGDFATDSDWTKGTGWTISGGTANSDGTSGLLSQTSPALTSGKIYKWIFEITSYTSGSVKIYSGSGSDDTAYKSAIGTFTQYFIANNTGKYFYSNSFNGSIDNISVKEVTRDNVPRIDYTGGGCPHILAEPQRTNTLTYSEDFSQSFWNQTTATVTSTTNTNPSGTSGTYSVERVTGSQLGSSFSVTSGNDYTASWYVRNISGTGAIIIKDTNNSTNNFTATSEWQRFSVTANASSGTGRCYMQVPTINDEVEVWGAQFEEGSYATSYIPTSGSTVTRNQDQFSRDGISSLINSTEGVLFVEMAALSDDLTYRIISLSDGTDAERLYIQYTSTTNQVSAVLKTGSSTQANIQHTLTDETVFSKMAFKWKANDFAFWIDGVEVGTDTSGSVPSGLNRLALDRQLNTNTFFGKVKQLQVYKTALTDAQLTSLTS